MPTRSRCNSTNLTKFSWNFPKKRLWFYELSNETSHLNAHRGVNVMRNVRDDVFQLHAGHWAIGVVGVTGFVDLQQPFHEQLVVQDSLQRSQHERVERQVAHFLRLKVPVHLLELLVSLERLLQLLQYQAMLLDITTIHLRFQTGSR